VKPSDRLVSLQYLRAVAAFLVVFNHGWDQLPWLKGRLPYPIGLSGVDVFFVISGFVMVFITNRREQTPVDFLAARIARVVPIYWVYTAATTLLLAVAPDLFQKNELSIRHVILSLAFVPHSVAADPGNMSPLLKLGWTLDYEMFFYALFAIAMAISWLQRSWIAVGTLVALAAVGMATNSLGATPARFYTDPLIIEFAFGMMLALTVGRTGGLRIHPAIASALILLGAAGLLLGSRYFDWNLRILVYGVPAALIVGGSVALESAGYVRAWRWPLLVGNASYSIYLVHLFPIALLRYLWTHAGLSQRGWGSALMFIAATMIAGTATGIASYWVLESPLLRVSHRLIAWAHNTQTAVAKKTRTGQR
jgi:exopolysaccharide production protein ExoZ